MQKNVAGQKVSFIMLNTSGFAPVTTGTPTIYVSGDGGAQSAGTGGYTYLANGEWVYAPTQAETNYDQVSFTMVLTNAINAKRDFDTVPAGFIATYDGTGYIDDVAPAQQQQVSNLAVGTAAISTVADSISITVGVQSGTYLDTRQADGSYNSFADVAGTTDIYYEFDVTGNGVPVSVTLLGRINAGNDDIGVFGYNWATTAWEQVGILEGQVSTTDSEHTYTLLSSHVGTGANLGKVRVRFYATTLTSSNLYIDYLYTSYAVVAESVGYANGSIWIDTANGSAGAVAFVNGTADNAVDNLADALTLSAELSINRFEVAQGSSLAFVSTMDHYAFFGLDYIIALGGQQVDSTTIDGAVLSGIATGNGGSLLLQNCKLGDVTLPEVACIHCAYAGTVTLGETGVYVFEAGFSAIAGQSSPIWDFGAAIGDTAVSFRHDSGGHDFRNMGQSGTDSVSLEGNGQYVLNANCVGGSLSVRGNYQKTDNSNGLVTIYDDANYTNQVIQSGFAQGAGTGSNQIQLSVSASAIDGAYDPSMIILLNGTGAGQSRNILDYAGATKIATVDRNWKVNPDITTDYRIVASPGREHVNEGVIQASSPTTARLNALASSEDDAYNGQVIFIRSGTGDDQARWITDYDGATKDATIDRAWDVQPTSNSGYVILPTGLQNLNMAETGDDMALKDDAITSAKFDESTAFPLKFGDSGATLVARTGADADTLATLSDQLDNLATTLALVFEDTDTTIPALIAALNDITIAEILAGTVADLADTNLDVGQTITVGKILRGLFNRFYREVSLNSSTLLEIVKGDSAQTVATMAVTDDGVEQVKEAAE